jgi:ribosomal protein S18 acetylase RimI-like enzyme
VTRPEIRPFTADDLEAAGQLLARRHARQRIAEPLLSARYETPSVAETEVRRVWESEGASGAVATTDGEVVGYLLGAPKGFLWGPNIWVENAGQAVERAGDIRDLYGYAAARWVDEDRTAHYAIVPAHDQALLEGWYRLGFGQQHMHALQETRTVAVAPAARVKIRPAERGDIPALAALEVALPQHHGLSPVFSAGETPSVEQVTAEWEEDFDDPTYAVFVAEYQGDVVGSAVGCSLEKSSSNVGLMQPDRAGFLGFAAVFPQYRGLGAGRALGDAVMAWATESGYPCIATDWRVTNLLSSRAWPALGYRDTFVRVHRLIGY